MDEIKKLLYETLNLVSKDKYQDAENIIKSILNNKTSLEKLNSNHWQYIADISLAIGKFDISKSAYIKANNMTGYAFILILFKELKEAKEALKKADPSPASLWCNFLIDLFSNKKILFRWPSFFTVRHFLEFTVYYLLLAENHDFVQILVKNLNKLLEINTDSEKFVGYAYFHFGNLDEALIYLNNSIQRNQFDGEIYFVLGQLYLMKHSPQEALAMLENAKLFMPEHVPTKDLIEKAKSMLVS